MFMKEKTKPHAVKDHTKSLDTKESTKPLDMKGGIKSFDTKKNAKLLDVKKGTKSSDVKKGTKPPDAKESTKLLDTKEGTKPLDIKEDTKPFAANDPTKPPAIEKNIKPVVAAEHIKPLVVGVITENVKKTAETGKTLGADVLEVRIDLLLSKNNDFEKYLKGDVEEIQLHEQLKNWMDEAKCAGLPVIATIRSKEESGLFEGTENERFKIIEKLIPLADYIDIERKSLKQNIFEAYAAAQKTNTKIIISSHYFDKTPSQKKIEKVLKDSYGKGAFISKIAVMPKNQKDILNLYQAGVNAHGKTCLIAMGDLGKQTRIIAPAFGSMLSYGYIHSNSAPGQLRVDEIKTAFKWLGWID
jgi:3-dehydroquinate dehydratase-1